MRAAEQNVELADRSGDAAERTEDRVIVAYALHQAARNAETLAAFRKAEVLQKERQPDYPLL